MNVTSKWIKLSLKVVQLSHWLQFMLSMNLLIDVDHRQCVIAVVDQINPPWISLHTEGGEEMTVHARIAPKDIREGEWVLYWKRTQILERLSSRQTHQELMDLVKLFNQISDQPTTLFSILSLSDPEHHSSIINKRKEHQK